MTAAKRMIIVSGAMVGSKALEAARDRQEGDILIGADRGALFLVNGGMKPDIALGDFDSVNDAERALIEEKAGKVVSFDAIDKDWTDTELAFQWALEQKPRQIVILGAMGTRMDHTLSNIFMLETALMMGIECVLIDEHNEIRLIDRSCTIVRSSHTYISLLALSSQVTGITLEGFQYPLENATLQRRQSLGISNVLIDDTGTIRIDSGLLLVIQSQD